jgi:hypothetical protein
LLLNVHVFHENCGWLNSTISVILISSKLADQTCGSLGCKADVQEVPTIVLEFSPGLLWLYEVWHCHYEAVPFLPVGLDVFCKLLPEASTELHSTMQNSHFHHTTENGLRVLPENPKTRKE